MRRFVIVAAALTAALGATVGVAVSQDTKMSFFVTSVGSGKGADLGGLKGADAHCASLAEAAGVTGKSWHAYLSTSAEDARDRIGKGPWFNAKGAKIADDVASLHSDANGITKQTALNEKGETVNGRGDTPNRHDMLTGSKPDGTRIADQTCGDWTMSGAEGAAMMGHHDRTGLDDSAAAKSWNSSHASRGGCSQEALKGTGGDGLFYCFATD
ncbi:MAG: hypothetical protein E5W64_02490 [Mesorhizobium sp.]|uniref:hypothetical protein n=1 Tax=unclassified Mesorhizobium TaxID=325217 RepID=UPI000FE74044|nr:MULTISPECIES: hypothetical protein [unclassified Mesorhizobium]TGU91919.1 hypothetical protein EN794_037970 [Mesorhizobium sp. M00.F.Ca.ET.151.01.1.1]RWC81906.1 MAG: hypothetical protein EOS72_31575 [Mesorhizobium sp.]TGP95702.1 hypothetical protein EN861_12475 [Mesorhizobium sp. M8A.F.Ca.ET.218.01.1.1]TGQ95729.1 hypothetical protein EN851_09520 [Mesorhizobium sp. M8A.F.Ca.ET.208.01.1.1]TGT18755.1 hypothetical protein EN856_12490 [Mesorhizobium sp. M8A.F.Ca.ET.213.01.1.1]